MSKVIVNSTPIIILSEIGRLSLLNNLFDNVIIPDAVYNEIKVKHDSVYRQLLLAMTWIKVCNVEKSSNLSFKARLHAGEIEVIKLGVIYPDSLLILDDNAAKNTAKALGLKVTGTLGILIQAKEKKLIDNVKPYIDKMLKAGFYVSSEIITMVLNIAGEIDK